MTADRPAPPSRRAPVALGLVALGLVALALRLLPFAVHGFEPSRLEAVDSVQYLELAEALEHGAGFSAADGSPEIFRTPGYPLVVAALGYLPGPVHPWLLALQALADAAAVVLLTLLVHRWLGRRAGWAAGVLAACDPSRVLYAQLVMADVLCGALVVAALTVLDRPTGARGKADARALAAGLALAAATALRPVVVLLWIPGALLLAARLRTAGGGLTRPGVVRAVALFAVAALSFPVAWSARNGLERDVWSMSTAFDVNLTLVAAAKVQARATGRAVDAGPVLARVAVVARDEGIEHHRASRQVALEVFRQHPRATVVEAGWSGLEMLLVGDRRYALQVLGLDDGGPSLGEGVRAPVSVVRTAGDLPPGVLLLVGGQVAWMLGLWTLALVGLRRWLPDRRLELTVTLLALGLVLGPSLVVATGRMRIPVASLITALAAAGACRLSGTHED